MFNSKRLNYQRVREIIPKFKKGLISYKWIMTVCPGTFLILFWRVPISINLRYFPRELSVMKSYKLGYWGYSWIWIGIPNPERPNFSVWHIKLIRQMDSFHLDVFGGFGKQRSSKTNRNMKLTPKQLVDLGGFSQRMPMEGRPTFGWLVVSTIRSWLAYGMKALVI